MSDSTTSKFSMKTIATMISILGTVLGVGVPTLFYVMDNRYIHEHEDVVAMIEQHIEMHQADSGVNQHDHEIVSGWISMHYEEHIEWERGFNDFEGDYIDFIMGHLKDH